jgi:hypothetical protein
MSDAQRRSFAPDILESNWLGYDGATEEQIQQADRRLGTTLPATYRKFLTVSNGWRMLATEWTGLLPVEEIGWFRELNEKRMNLCIQGATRRQDYRDVHDHPGDEMRDDEDEAYVFIPASDLRASLQISNDQETTVLLNPNVVTPKGEWQLLHLTPDTQLRYKSFRAFMREEYRNLL